MYRLLVVDDEQIVLDAVKMIISKNFEDVVVAETARSGREAIEKVETARPDIVLMDIRMPGINGIDAIKEIKKRFGTILFIIVSAYEQFDFAKEAVNLGVTGYLLKPINRNKLVEAVQNAVKIVEKEREKRNKELENKEKMEKVLSILEHGFIYSILMGEDYSKDLEQYKELFQITEDGGYMMVVEFGEEEAAGNLTNKIGFSVKSQLFYPYFRDMLKYKCKCLVGPSMINRISVFVPTKLKEEYSQRLEAVALAEYIESKILDKIDVDFYIGIGSYKKIDDLSVSYEEALKAIRYNKDKGIIHIMDITEEKHQFAQYPLKKEKLLLEKVSAGETESALYIFGEIVKWMNTAYEDTLEIAKNKWMELMVLLHRLAFEAGVDEDIYIKYEQYLGEMLAIEDFTILQRWCMERIGHIANSIKNIKENKVSRVIVEAKAFIDQQFHKEITLEEVSKEVAVSPQYFSRLFKEQIGQNFIEYLTTTRINKAKELLEHSNLTVKEICFEIGYSDPNYFSRLFKKVVGVSPTEYVKSL